MESLEQLCEHYYFDENYNCAEALLHAANDFYQLEITEADLLMMAGFGKGIFSGQTCGALVAATAALSKLLVKKKAHEELDTIRPACQLLVRNFRQDLDGTLCVDLHKKWNTTDRRCIRTVLAGAKALQDTLAEVAPAI